MLFFQIMWSNLRNYLRNIFDDVKLQYSIDPCFYCAKYDGFLHHDFLYEDC